MSRSQMEIFGLVIIVILISIGLLFAIFVLTKPPQTEVAEVQESVLAANFLNTVLSTSAVGCGKRDVRALLQDCAVSGSNALVCPAGKNSCEFAEDVIKHMLDRTLGEWGKDYQFLIDGTPSVERINVKTSECLGEVEAASRPEKVRAGLDMVITLKLCR